MSRSRSSGSSGSARRRTARARAAAQLSASKPHRGPELAAKPAPKSAPKSGAKGGSDAARAAAATPGSGLDAQSAAVRRREAMMAVSGIVRRQAATPEVPVPLLATKGRRGKKSVTVFLHPLAKAKLDEIAHRTGKSIQDLGVEAINLLLLGYDHKPIA